MPTSPFTIEACQALAQEQMEMLAYVRGRLFNLGFERSDLGGPSPKAFFRFRLKVRAGQVTEKSYLRDRIYGSDHFMIDYAGVLLRTSGLWSRPQDRPAF